MRLTRSFYRTFKEVPKDAQISSHQLMFRTGMIQQLASGIYSYLPLALRSLRKIETIIRDELNQRGCEEVLMPAVLPAALWQESGRWNAYGDLLLRFQDRKGSDYCMGPTHEEAFTDMVRRHLSSWKQLPWNLYQIQDKFRDEFRPRFGLMRGREFIMKDAYSFDLDEQAAAKSYRLMYEAYSAIFTRCGLKFRAVDAAAGEIGGSMSHEFQVLASSGEDVLLSCTSCSYAVNIEKAAVLQKPNPPDKTQFKDMEIVETPGQKTIEEVSQFLGVQPEKFLKSLVYEADSRLVLVLIAGNLDVNEVKLQAVLNASALRLAAPEKVKEAIGAEPGFIGPVNLPPNINIIADFSASSGENWISGANQNDKHTVNINPERDFQVSEFADITFAAAGDTCPECKEGQMEEFRGIEVGHVFYLGTKYSQAMNCLYLDEEGNSKPVEMGCYGIGIGRTMAAAIEQNHDENGIIWPVPLAPWEAIVLPLQMNNETVTAAAEKVYIDLTQAGIETVLDDRNERPGFKFKDADLIGYPVQITLGARSAAEGKAEIKFRASGEKTELPLDDAVNYIIQWIEDKRQTA
ncbi:MAG: proline--tRNA ligase [Spirochaeta sp. LUC14_002_19_P3]|nr:MAG: proline--tRNA ligase [Spirochaeta sp. LUC14_002_19_P3]